MPQPVGFSGKRERSIDADGAQGRTARDNKKSTRVETRVLAESIRIACDIRAGARCLQACRRAACKHRLHGEDLAHQSVGLCTVADDLFLPENHGRNVARKRISAWHSVRKGAKKPRAAYALRCRIHPVPVGRILCGIGRRMGLLAHRRPEVFTCSREHAYGEMAQHASSGMAMLSGSW